MFVFFAKTEAKVDFKASTTIINNIAIFNETSYSDTSAGEHIKDRKNRSPHKNKTVI